eukprot:279325-Rhodomonas_salina.2
MVHGICLLDESGLVLEIDSSITAAAAVPRAYRPVTSAYGSVALSAHVLEVPGACEALADHLFRVGKALIVPRAWQQLVAFALLVSQHQSAVHVCDKTHGIDVLGRPGQRVAEETLAVQVECPKIVLGVQEVVLLASGNCAKVVLVVRVGDEDHTAARPVVGLDCVLTITPVGVADLAPSLMLVSIPPFSVLGSDFLPCLLELGVGPAGRRDGKQKRARHNCAVHDDCTQVCVLSVGLVDCL